MVATQEKDDILNIRTGNLLEDDRRIGTVEDRKEEEELSYSGGIW